MLGIAEGAEVRVTHAPALESLASVRRRIYGNRLDALRKSEAAVLPMTWLICCSVIMRLLAD